MNCPAAVPEQEFKVLPTTKTCTDACALKLFSLHWRSQPEDAMFKWAQRAYTLLIEGALVQAWPAQSSASD